MRKLNYEKLVTDIQNWIKDYFKSANADGLIIGISGGIDSSVSAALCVNAIGKENVYGLSLPCESISQDVEDAKLIAKELGLNFKVIDLNPFFNKYTDDLGPYINPNKITTANLKSRMRMMTLYYFGQSIGTCLIVGTGNRAEIAIGYFTKYGDGGTDIEPIGGLYKQEVRQIAKLLKIPVRIIKKPPSPGLWLGQTDEGEIGLSYDTIDEILYRIDYNLDFEGLEQENVESIKMMMRKAEHKLNMPPMFNVGNIIN
jgi:NAD+ synthase